MLELHGPVGRLVMLRVTAPLTMEDIQGLIERFPKILLSFSTKGVVCIDLLGSPMLDSEQADAMLALQKRDNPKIERSAFLLPPDGKGVLALQVERVIREAQNPNRKSFRSRKSLESFLGEVLAEEEMRALQAFLDS